MSLTIIGAGAFGTSLAQSFACGGCNVTLWGRNARDMASLAQTRQTPRLPGITIHDRVDPCSELGADISKIILLAVPLQNLRNVLKDLHLGSEHILVACNKGVELETGLGPTGIIDSVSPNSKSAILTGPSFANDIANGLPTALTLACQDDAVGQQLQSHLIAPNLRIYRTSDTIGAECGGALKNVIAIACGAAIGAGLGESARAALMTRGFAEMKRLAVQRGARAETLAGLSGLGDLSLTCSSDLSRNYRFGHALGRGAAPDLTQTVEGAATARAVLQDAERLDVDMPITEVVVRLIDQNLNLREAIEQLLSRPPKEE